MTEEQEEIGFLIPRGIVGDSSEFVHVNPAKPAANELATMLRDFLGTGDFTVCRAAMDWLRERGEYESERRVQLANLTRLLRVLACGAIKRAEDVESRVEQGYRDSHEWFTNRVATDWVQFKAKVTELFAFDLYERDDAIRFVVEVMRPGKMNGNADVA